MDHKNNAMGQGSGEKGSGQKGTIIITANFVVMGLLLYGILSYLTDNSNVKAALIGYSLMVLNLAAVGLAWSWIIKKKFIALTTPLIVLKYALLGLVLYLVVKGQNLDLTWFVTGFIWFFLAVIVAGIIKPKSEG